MIKFLKLLFGNGKDKQPMTIANPEVHNVHNFYTSKLSEIGMQAKVIEKESKKLSKMIDTATRISMVTPGGSPKKHKK